MSTVLIADDEPDMRLLISMVVSQRHDVVCVEDGAAALERLRAGGIDLAVLDVTMPHVTGLEVVRCMRQEPQLEPIPVLMASAMSTNDDITAAYAAGADRYLTKPFSLVALRAAVEELSRTPRHRAATG